MRLLSIALVVAALGVPAARAGQADTVAASKSLVRKWSARVNAYDNAGVAHLFSRPSTFAQGGSIYELRTYQQIAIWHRSLPCAARIASITVKGADATAVFVLQNGKNRRCDAPGAKVAAVFRISGGKIRIWAQLPVPEADGPTA